MNIEEKSKEKSALIILYDSEFSEQLLQGNGEEVNCELWYLGLQGQVAILQVLNHFSIQLMNIKQVM